MPRRPYAAVILLLAADIDAFAMPPLPMTLSFSRHAISPRLLILRRAMLRCRLPLKMLR